MTNVTRIFGWLMLLALTGCAHAPAPLTAAAPSKPLVILVSIDGFRADYFDRGLTPNIAALAAGGVHAQSMRPAFPSITFPNHYTLVTGLYPDHHGIVNNTMEDPSMPGMKFTTDDARDPRWWDGATPIWETAHRQGLRTASVFWPASDIPHHGVLPDHVLPYDEKTPPDQRTDTVLGWLDLPPGQRPAFITLYFNQVDSAGHAGGPDSEGVNQALRSVDAAIGRLVDGLRQRGLFAQTDLVILADHGMDGISAARTIYLDDLVKTKDVHVEAIGSMTGLRAEPGREKVVEHALLCLADEGWSIWTHDFAAKINGKLLGMHGYDNADPHMGALFVAEGPAFRQGVPHPTFDNVDVYPLVTHLLGITPERNDGKLSEVADMLKPGN